MQEVAHLSSLFNKVQFDLNNGGNFSNILNSPLRLNQPNALWKIGLAELLYTPGSWDNVRTGHNTITVQINKFPIWRPLKRTVYVAHIFPVHSGSIRRKKYYQTKKEVNGVKD